MCTSTNMPPHNLLIAQLTALASLGLQFPVRWPQGQDPCSKYRWHSARERDVGHCYFIFLISRLRILACAWIQRSLRQVEATLSLFCLLDNTTFECI